MRVRVKKIYFILIIPFLILLNDSDGEFRTRGTAVSAENAQPRIHFSAFIIERYRSLGAFLNAGAAPLAEKIVHNESFHIGTVFSHGERTVE